ncbi:MAG: lipid A deacylase LpxR family protein [Bacteroidota bacterium]
MRILIKTAFFMAISLFLRSPLIGQEIIHEIIPPQQLFRSNSAHFYIDNDVFSRLLTSRDRNYTMGVGFGYAHERLVDFPLIDVQQKALRAFWALSHPNGKEHAKRLEWLTPSLTLANKSFTPEDLAEEAPVFNDRPYGNVTLLESRVRLWDPAQNTSHAFTLSVGGLGLPMARETQILFHKIHQAFKEDSKAEIPEGWDNQISNPGELTFQIHYGRERYWYASKWVVNKKDVFVDLRESIDLYAGYQTNLSYALTGRMGWNENKHGSKRARTWYGFVRARPTIVAYDALLQGQFKESAYTLESTDINTFVGEFSAGMGVSWPWGKNRMHLLYGYYYRTPEASFNGNSYAHTWGRFQLVYSF